MTKEVTTQQGILSNLVDLGANTIKGIGRGVLPGLFKTTMASAPNNVGIVAPRALFKIGTGAQRIAEFDPDRSVRITGCGLFGDRLWRVATRGIYPFTPIPDVNPFAAWRGIAPMSVDPRMMQLADAYQYYAFRFLRFTYIPETGTSGNISRCSLCLGISQDAQEFVDLPAPSMVQMAEQNQSIMTPVWCPTTLSYTHDGTRVWRTDPSGEGTIDEVVQCLLGGVLSAAADGLEPGDQGVIGQLYVEYVCDLYEPQPVPETQNTTIALPFSISVDETTVTPSAVYDGNQYPPGFNRFTDGPQTIPNPFAEMGLMLAKQEELSAKALARGRRTSAKHGKLIRQLPQLSSNEVQFVRQAAQEQALVNERLRAELDELKALLSLPGPPVLVRASQGEEKNETAV